MNPEDLDFDRHHIWHPYTSMVAPLPCYPVIGANGCELQLADHRCLVDGMSSWWAVIHGYNHPQINQAIQKQLQAMSHVMFGGLTHPAAIALCRRLIAMTPTPLECVFLADSGSVAIEVAIKMTLQYWQAQGEQRQRFLTIRHGYHGDTFAAMSVSDPHNSCHNLYQGYLPQQLFAPAPQCGFYDPWQEQDFTPFAQLIAVYQSQIAGVILEPIVQGAGGMRFYHPHYLQRVRTACDRHGIPLIVDEIATGFGRSGKLFAYEHADIIPDILCLGKALTGGYMTLSATLTTRHIAEVMSRNPSQCFMHGPTFMANPLSCSAAIASLDLIASGKWKTQVATIEQQLKQQLSSLRHHPLVHQVRVLGAIGVVETKYPVNQAQIQRYFVAQGVWIRPFARLIYLMPPYIITAKQLTQLTQSLANALDYPQHFITKHDVL